jgi:hypothetical protein
MILCLASYSSELSLSFGAAMLTAGLATVMNERLQAIHRDFALIRKRNAEIELGYCMLLEGEDEDDGDSDRNLPTLPSSPWMGSIQSGKPVYFI